MNGLKIFSKGTDADNITTYAIPVLDSTITIEVKETGDVRYTTYIDLQQQDVLNNQEKLLIMLKDYIIRIEEA